MWDLIEKKMVPISYPTTVGISTFTYEQFKIHKLKVHALIVMAANDKFKETILKSNNHLDT